jgi:hypothetical protein
MARPRGKVNLLPEYRKRGQPKKTEPDAREIAMAAMYEDNKTLAEIGNEFGLTRERVRQLIKRCGLSGKDSGKRKTALQKQAELSAHNRAEWQAMMNKKCLMRFGLSYSEVVAINGGKSPFHRDSISYRFERQKRSAGDRQIDWNLTFPQWLSVWNESGKLSERGRGKIKYVMARFRDLGAYEIGNVAIITNSQNSMDCRAEVKRRGHLCEDGYWRYSEKPASVSVKSY